MSMKIVPRTLKEKQRQEREQLILEAAQAVLVEKGYHETSMDEIAARVGIAKGTVYLHFASKEDLVGALFERDMQTFFQLIEKEMVSAVTVRDKLEAILHVLYGKVFNQRIHLLYTIYNSAELRKTLIEKKGCMREMWVTLSERIAALLDEGKVVGEFDATLSTAVMLSAFLSLLSSRNYERLLVEEQIPAEELAHQLAHIYFKGISADTYTSKGNMHENHFI